MAEIKVTGALKWHGGKNAFQGKLAKWIVSLFPPHLHYVEPYFGGGAVLFARDPERDWLIDEAWKLKNGEKVPSALQGCSEVVNDINKELTTFWRVLQNSELFAIFQREIEATPFSKVEFNDADPAAFGEDEPVGCAINFFIRCRQSLAGRMKGFATLSKARTRGRINEQASAWLSAVMGLPEVHKRLSRVVILCGEALAVIRQQDSEQTLFYLDPPYLHETRASTGEYAHEMTNEQHAELLAVMAGIRGKFLLSGYRSALYDAYAAKWGWNRHDFTMPNNAAGGEEKRRMTESLWVNFDALPPSESTP